MIIINYFCFFILSGTYQVSNLWSCKALLYTFFFLFDSLSLCLLQFSFLLNFTYYYLTTCAFYTYSQFSFQSLTLTRWPHCSQEPEAATTLLLQRILSVARSVHTLSNPRFLSVLLIFYSIISDISFQGKTLF